MKKILLIEDHEDLRNNIAELLELSNYQVLKAENGRQGLEMALSEKPDLIVCDIMMPLLDGYEVRHALQQNRETSVIPFIFLTAQSGKNDWRRGMTAGADDYLTKPFEGIELLKAIEACLIKKEGRCREVARDTVSFPGPVAPGLPSGELPLGLGQRETVDFKKKQMIYIEGQRPANVFYIVKGKVKTYKIYQDGKEFITLISGPGDFIGFTAMLEDTNYRDRAQVLEDAVLILIPRQEFLELTGRDTATTRHFIQLLVRNAGEKEEDLLNLAYNSLRKRVANCLLQIWDKFRDGQGESSAIDISRENLAHVIGSATESLTRTLSEFRDEKLIDIREGKIYLLNEAKLRTLIN